MKMIPFALALALLCAGCKNGGNAEMASAEAGPAQTSNAAVPLKRQFAWTAECKFRVKNVMDATDEIRRAVSQSGGFTTSSNLESRTLETGQVKVSPDSALTTTRFVVENQMTLRVPNKKLDTVMRTIARRADFLDSQTIKADDVALQMLSNELAKERNENHGNRLGRDIDTKGRKISDIAAVENQRLAADQARDSAQIGNLALAGKTAMSTVKLSFYQPETVRQELVPLASSREAYRPHIGLQMWDSVKSGWFILEEVLAFVMRLWSLILLGWLGFWLLRKYVLKPKMTI